MTFFWEVPCSRCTFSFISEKYWVVEMGEGDKKKDIRAVLSYFLEADTKFCYMRKVLHIKHTFYHLKNIISRNIVPYNKWDKEEIFFFLLSKPIMPLCYLSSLGIPYAPQHPKPESLKKSPGSPSHVHTFTESFEWVLYLFIQVLYLLIQTHLIKYLIIGILIGIASTL